MTETIYRADEVADLVGIPYRSLMRWVQGGILNPEGARRGHRKETTWHPEDLREASVLVALRRAGFSMQKLRRALDWLRSAGHNPMSTGDFIAVRLGNGEHPSELIKICDTGEAMTLIQQPGQLVMRLQPIGGDE